MSRRIAVVTGSRADYGLLYWTLRQIHQDPDLSLLLVVTGMHLSPEFGMTVRDIERDGLPVTECVEILLSSDSGQATATAMGIGLIKFGEVWARLQPDIILVLGDRFEILAAVAAALPLVIPVAHIHGGESTEGLIDEGIRHAVTKLAHLHFASTDRYAQRIRQMGEEAWRVTVCGAPGLERIRRMSPLGREELERRLGADLGKPTLLVTYHPVTLEPGLAQQQISNLLAALDEVGLSIIFTQSNADPGGRIIAEQTKAFAATRPWCCSFDNLGMETYASLMRYATAMVGNSSSGIIEAGSLGLPVVNIGERQRQRVRGPNVIDAGYGVEEIVAAIRRASSSEFRAAIAGASNPYDFGTPSETIVRVLKTVPLGQRLIKKEFEEHPLKALGTEVGT
jgi:GDP/UDP-N,N'-diacetylbacillosamine 2-epimerase (hydrolysing)